MSIASRQQLLSLCFYKQILMLLLLWLITLISRLDNHIVLIERTTINSYSKIKAFILRCDYGIYFLITVSHLSQKHHHSVEGITTTIM